MLQCSEQGVSTALHVVCSQVVACPGGVAVGHTYFIPSEEHLESGITTRAFMEAKLVVCLAGRCAGPAFVVH